MTNEKFRSDCVLYLTATCNLKCNYCYIDKSPVLQEIDKLLEQTYQGDYYINFMKKMFPDPKQLKKIEFWGGEPSYGLPRVYNTIDQAIKYYPNLQSFMMSTNLTTPTWLDDFYSFLKVFKNYPERCFTFYLQLSLDGPTEINDGNRGKGVTEKFTKNFYKLINNLDNILQDIPNVSIFAHFKPTLDNNSIKQLQTKESIINYYQFFEQYKDLSLKVKNTKRWNLDLPIPNTAVPSPHSQEDGKRFANLCKLSYEISLENKQTHGKYFKYFINIVPFSRRRIEKISCLERGCGTCGTGKHVLGLLPNNLISSCHNGFVDLVGDYKKQAINNADENHHSIDFNFFLNNSNNKVAYTVEEYEIYEHIVNCYHPSAKFQSTEVGSQIHLYASMGQLDEQYQNPEKALEGAHFIFQTTSSCLRDNLNTTGSRYLVHPGLIKLLLNGAKEWIELANQEFSR